MQVETLAVESLRPYSCNARTHSNKQIRQVAKSIQRFGFCNPCSSTISARSSPVTAEVDPVGRTTGTGLLVGFSAAPTS